MFLITVLGGQEILSPYRDHKCSKSPLEPFEQHTHEGDVLREAAHVSPGLIAGREEKNDNHTQFIEPNTLDVLLP